LISQVISHYRILGRLDDSSMGEVYLAEDTRLGRNVALRLFPASYHYDANRNARLIRDASAAAALRSPHTALIYDIGEHEGAVYIVGEYIEGELLSARIERGVIAPREAIDIAAQVADALDEAHNRDIVHGDIKSANIIINERGLAKVCDFGLGEATGRNREYRDDDRTDKLGQETALDFMSADVSYMSPEQALGQAIDLRSDIFSLGVVMYEMVNGRLPFEGETPVEIIDRIVHQPVERLGRINYSTPLELERIIRKCLEKSPDSRYQSARDLLIDLKNLKRDTDSGAMRNARRRTTGRMKAAARSRRRKAITSLAVLPMINASDDAGTEYLSDGITETLINSLSQLPKLRVMARSTVFRYKNKNLSPQEIGAALKVEAVLAGRSTLRDGRLIISVELVDMHDGSRLWGQQYNRKLSDIFAIQEEISREITDSLRLKLTGEEKKRLAKRFTENTEAYQHYLKGRYFWNRRTEEGLLKGIEHFKQAIEADTLYAMAYSGLADCYNMMCWWNITPVKEGYPKARAAAERALDLDDALAEAHASMGGVMETAWNWKTAEREYKRAIELNPNYASARQWYAEYLAHIGNFDDALAEMRIAESLDPLSNIINTEVGWIMHMAGDYDRAIEQYRAAIELDPEFAAAHWRLGEAYLRKHLFDEAILEIERAMELSGNSLQMLARLGYGYALAGRKYESLGVLSQLNEASKQRYVSPYDVAVIYAGLGEKDLTFTWLERAYEDRTTWLAFLKVEPAFDSLRQDARFRDLLGRVGLPV
jgi:serine/threonine-protein kinase